jgi:UDP-GlcNAc:undecaprenyl-phosphate GlcNAc-1-phosphate transferase
MLFFAALCIVAVVAARVVFPREIREEVHQEMEELKEHRHHEEEKKDGES